MNRKQRAYLNAGIFFGAFVLLTILVLKVDVRPIGADGTNVGLSHLNGFFHFITRSHPYIYVVTELIKWIAIAVMASFIFLGVGVLIKNRTLKSIRGIACLFPIYAAMIPFYFIFNVFTVNCGPALFLGENHPSNSFPSLTTMFCLVVFSTAMLEWHKLFRNHKELLAKLDKVMLGLMGATLLIRLIAGMNWFTDLFAAILITLSLLNLYKGLCIRIVYKTEQTEEERIREEYLNARRSGGTR